MSWRSTVFEGRNVNFWEQSARHGKVECVGRRGEGFRSGPTEASAPGTRFLDLTAPGGPKQVAERDVGRTRLQSCGAAPGRFPVSSSVREREPPDLEEVFAMAASGFAAPETGRARKASSS